MNSNAASDASRAAALGNRTMSLGAAMKELRAGRNGAAPQIEYELGNGVTSGENSDDGNGSGMMPSNSRRVMMMYDDEGKATPMPMAKFYYDSVQADGDDGEEDKTTNTSQTSETENIRSNVPARFSAHGDYSDSDSSQDLRREAKGAPGRPSATLEKPSANVPESYVDDAEDDEYEDDDKQVPSAEDRFKNQFMRIEIPAARLKDVSRVKKDVDHDKPHRRNSIMVGLQRAVSTVKIADGGRSRAPGSSTAPPVARQASVARASLSKVGRLMSLSREKSQSEDKLPEGNHAAEAQSGGLERLRENTAHKPVKRQGLAGVGRMLSINRSREYSTDPKPPSQEERFPDVDKGRESQSIGRLSRQSTVSGKPSARAGLGQMGRMMSFSRKKTSNQTSNKTIPGRASDGDLVNSTHSVDRRRAEVHPERTPNPQMRSGLAKMGRMLSLRTKKQTQTPVSQHEDMSAEKHQDRKSELSPVSTSTVSSNAVDFSPSENERQDRNSERSRPTSSSTNVRKEASRMSVKAAGRLLSFSRKPHASSGSGSRGRTLLAKEDDSLNKSGNSRRGTSVPPTSADGENAAGDEPGQKLDGRANKFFYTEINSEKVQASGSFGNELHIRVPVIAMAEYSGPVSKTKWYIDGFTLPHNAVRRECVDLYEILSAMARCSGDGDITRDDIDDFEDWWKTASAFFHCYFEMERTILFPWVDAAGSTDWEVQFALKKMRSMKDRLQEQLTKVDSIWNEKTFKGPGEMYALVYKAVDEFVPRLMNYFADQEVLLPAIVRGFYKLEDRLKLDKDMVNLFMGPLTRKNKEEPHHSLILLVRWIGSARQLRAWNGKNLSSTARGLYGTWWGQFQQQHLRFVKMLQTRSKAMLDMSP